MLLSDSLYPPHFFLVTVRSRLFSSIEPYFPAKHKPPAKSASKCKAPQHVLYYTLERYFLEQDTGLEPGQGLPGEDTP
jgi:hypothetical protein